MLSLHLGLLAAQLVNMALLIAWLALALVALNRLRTHDLPAGVRVLWVALILLVPLLGAAAWLMLHPRERAPRA